MPRSFDGLRVLLTAQDVLDCLSEDPSDRVFVHTIDLTPDEWSDGVATRTDEGCFVVMSMRALGATTIDDFVNMRRVNSRIGGYSPMPGEIAAVGCESKRDRFGRIVPDCIRALLVEAEEMPPGRRIAWAGYEGLCVLRAHPEADSPPH